MKLRIAVLEDDDLSAAMTADVLTAQGHGVDVYPTCADAWRGLRAAPPELLLLDTDLNGEFGWDFLADLRRDLVFRDLPTIVASGTIRPDVVKRYLTIGVQGMLAKPFSSERLAIEIARANRAAWWPLVFEPLEAVGARTGFTGVRLGGLYRQAAAELEGLAGELAEDDAFVSDPVRYARLTALRSAALNLGFTLLLRLVDELFAAAKKRDGVRAECAREALAVAARLLEIQAQTAAAAERVIQLANESAEPAGAEIHRLNTSAKPTCPAA